MAIGEKGSGEKGAPTDGYPPQQPANMAAGSARIVRYILFAFFVSKIQLLLVYRLIRGPGYHDPLLHVLFFDTSTAFTNNIKSNG